MGAWPRRRSSTGANRRDPPVAGATAPASSGELALRRHRLRIFRRISQSNAAQHLRHLLRYELDAACHGARVVAIAPNFPNLAGQSATYLHAQLKEFHDGQRTDPVMSGQTAALSDANMRDLAV